MNNMRKTTHRCYRTPIVTIPFEAALVCLLFCAVAWAQSTAQINGTVRDQSGAVLPGVDVKATQTATAC